MALEAAALRELLATMGACKRADAEVLADVDDERGALLCPEGAVFHIV